MANTVQELANASDLLGSRAEMARLFQTTVTQHGVELSSEKAAHASTATELAATKTQLAAETTAHLATQAALASMTAKHDTLLAALKTAGIAITTAEKE